MTSSAVCVLFLRFHVPRESIALSPSFFACLLGSIRSMVDAFLSHSAIQLLSNFVCRSINGIIGFIDAKVWRV